jgi:hypothetical protein
MMAVAAIALTAAACGQVQARTPPAAPPPTLDTPTPPTPLLVPVPDPPVKEPLPEPPGPPAVNPRPAGGARSTAPPPPTPPPPQDGPTPVLQTSTNIGEMEQRTRDMLDAADRDLKRVSLNSLSRDARAQYFAAQRFVTIAREALESRNYLYAHATAQKAAKMAGLLIKGVPLPL